MKIDQLKLFCVRYRKKKRAKENEHRLRDCRTNELSNNVWSESENENRERDTMYKEINKKICMHIYIHIPQERH
jgi:hypothetical protein